MDPYNHEQLADNHLKIDQHDHTTGKGTQIPSAGIQDGAITTAKITDAAVTASKLGSGAALTNLGNGSIAAPNLTNVLAQSAGVNESGQVVKGAVNIPTSETRSSSTYGTLTTPDQVSNIVLPANGLIAVWYQADWLQSGSNIAKAAIFLNSNQLRTTDGGNPVQEATDPNGTATPSGLGSAPKGLVGWDPPGGPIGTVTTGVSVSSANPTAWTPEFGGGPCYIYAAAGTYTVSIQFKVSSGSVTASNRRLWVLALSFA